MDQLLHLNMLKFKLITPGHLLQDVKLDKLPLTSKLVIRIIKRLMIMVLLPHHNLLRSKLLICGLQSLDASLDRPQLTSKHAIKTTKKSMHTAQLPHLNTHKFN